MALSSNGRTSKAAAIWPREGGVFSCQQRLCKGGRTGVAERACEPNELHFILFESHGLQSCFAKALLTAGWLCVDGKLMHLRIMSTLEDTIPCCKKILGSASAEGRV